MFHAEFTVFLFCYYYNALSSYLSIPPKLTKSHFRMQKHFVQFYKIMTSSQFSFKKVLTNGQFCNIMQMYSEND